MAEKDELEHEPWSPRIEGKPLFLNSADYERSLGEGSSPPDIDISNEGPEETRETVSAVVADQVPVGTAVRPQELDPPPAQISSSDVPTPGS
jgi:hypothetical protein